LKVLNIHSREYPVAPEKLGQLVDTLASSNDLLWPHRLWPRMKFDKPLTVSANGGHGPVRYFVEEFVPAKRVVFRFTGPKGFDGYHGYDVIELENNKTELRQTLELTTRGMAQISWPLLYRPLHDALIEDSLSFAELRLNLTPTISGWSWWVRFLRWAMSGGKSRPQRIA